MTFKRRTIAFVYYPHHPEHDRLDTMPFAITVIRKLIAAGWTIRLFLWEGDTCTDYRSLFPQNLSIEYVTMYTKRARLRIGELGFRFFRYSYACVFSVGQLGSYVGRIISMASKCPLVMLNDEFPSQVGQSIWTYLEKWSAHRANVIIVPSDDRKDRLIYEFDLEREKPFVTIHNTPEVDQPLAELDWHSRFGIPQSKRIFLHAGLLHDWAQIPEIMTSVRHWPKDLVLLLHSKSGDGAVSYRREFSHLQDPERIFWSFEPLSEGMLHSLISSVSGCFALYRNWDINTELIGASSGKLMRSIVCGTPVITSSFKSLEFVTRAGIGIQVNHPFEIPPAVHDLDNNAERYRKQCLLFSAEEKLRQDKAWDELVAHVRKTSKAVNLYSPPRDEGRLELPITG